MENSIIHNPTKVYFGKGIVEKSLIKEIQKLGNKVMIIYGISSIKKNGIYNQITSLLDNANIKHIECSGIKPNPIVEDVDKAIHKAKQEKPEIILAVGGGSVIDSAKIIAAGYHSENAAWDFFTGKEKIRKALPLINILTLAATGTEMNPFAVLQHNANKEKLGIRSNHIYPRVSFLDPSHTLSVPKDQTVNGIIDLISHSLEAYFGYGKADLSDRFVFSVINEAIEAGSKLVDSLENYELRARIMYAATTALNNTLFYGRKGGDWTAHGVAHLLSLLFDTAHGASLSIVFPAWMKLNNELYHDRLILLGQNVFGVNTADECIESFISLYHSFGAPTRLSDINLNTEQQERFYQLLTKQTVTGIQKGEIEVYKKFLSYMA